MKESKTKGKCADTDRPVRGQEGVAGDGIIYTGQPTIAEKWIFGIQYVRQELSSDVFKFRIKKQYQNRQGKRACYSW
jgi:hypothetical protein